MSNMKDKLSASVRQAKGATDAGNVKPSQTVVSAEKNLPPVIEKKSAPKAAPSNRPSGFSSPNSVWPD